jgi:hypothetical protein
MGVNKFLAPAQYQKIWGYFYGFELGATMPYIMGSGRVAVCLAMAIGLGRTVTYCLGFAMHAVTISVIAPSLMAPFVIENGFPINRNSSVALAALAGFAALWLLRSRDRWSFDVWWKGRAKSTYS